MKTALESLSQSDKVHEIIIFGGTDIFAEALKDHSNSCKLIIETRINKDCECDRFFPETDKDTIVPLLISRTYSQDDVTIDF